MFDCFLAQLLVLIMIFVCCSRIFVLKKARVDCFAAFAPVALFVSVCIFLCFNFSFQSLAVFLLALLVFFTNFRSVLRLAETLVIDSYSPIFIVFTILSLVLTVALLSIIIILRPVKYHAKDFNVETSEYTLTGSNMANLRVKESVFSGERSSAKVFVYSPVIRDEITQDVYGDNPLLLFSPGIRAKVQDYEPYLMLLAQKGYRVLAADFYSDDIDVLSPLTENKALKAMMKLPLLKRFMAIHIEEQNPEEFAVALEKDKGFATKKYSALTKIALELFGDETKCFYIVDNVDFDSIYAVIDEFNTEPYSNAKGFFSMNRVDEYKTSGYGFIEQTDVLLAYHKGLERENKFFIARYVANKTIKAIQEQTGGNQ